MHVAILLAAAAAVLAARAADAEPVQQPVLLAQTDSAAPADSATKPADTEKKPARKRRKTKKQLAAEKAEALKKAEEAQKAEEDKKAADAKAAAAEKEAADAKAAAATPTEAPPAAPPADAAPAEPPPPAPVVESAPPAPAPAEAPPPPPTDITPSAPPAAAAAAPAGEGGDDEAPNVSHTPVTHAPRAKPLHLEARAVDPSGVFQVVLYLRRHGGSDFIPFKMNPDKTVMGNYTVDLPTALVSTDLEYYVETYDNVGNGPARTGTPERPLQIKLDEPVVVPKPEEEKIKVVLQQQKPPPAITHSSVSKVQKGKSVELVAKMKGPAGVSKPSVQFRSLGSDTWKSLPMGNLGETYTATIPASQTTAGDIEYYVEAYDGSGVSASHSASADAPFLIRVVDEPPPPLVSGPLAPTSSRRAVREPPPFRANPGQAFGYLALAGAIGGLSFAGGEAYAAWQSNENYQQTLKFQGRNDPALLKRANEYGNRAKTFAIAGGIAAVVATVLLIVFAPGDDAPPPAGSGGDVPLFKF